MSLCACYEISGTDAGCCATRTEIATTGRSSLRGRVAGGRRRRARLRRYLATTLLCPVRYLLWGVRY
eukprot:918417-Rhodomonas_salina.2